MLRLPDGELIAAVGGGESERIAREWGKLDVAQYRRRAAGAGIEAICRCDPEYPARLRMSASAPAVLHIVGAAGRFLTLMRDDPVAIVGSRRASPYGLEVARALGRELASAGVAAREMGHGCHVFCRLCRR